MLDEDPIIIVRNLLINNWNSNNTVLADDPKIHTGWYDFGSSDPQVTVTDTEEGVMDGGVTGHTAGTGNGGVVQYRVGQMLVNCWAGTYEDMEGQGANGSDVSPKAASYDMANEVHRIMQENASGTTDDSGNKQLHSLSTTDAQRMADDNRDPTIFRYQTIVEYTYSSKTE